VKRLLLDILVLFVMITLILPVARADPTYESREQDLINQVLSKCNDMPDSEAVHARANKALELIQRDGTSLGPDESSKTVERFVIDSIPDGVGKQKCVDLMVVYVRMRETGAITG
jgi:hypothetical protein